MRSLSTEQWDEIRKHSTDWDFEYVSFYISVFNAGCTIRLEFSDEPEYFDPETWNGYDFCSTLTDVVELMNKYNL